jgi:hypothetical protein
MAWTCKNGWCKDNKELTRRQTRRKEEKRKPRLRWTDDVASDLRNMGVKRWRSRVLDKTEWASIVREAKAKFEGL